MLSLDKNKRLIANWYLATANFNIYVNNISINDRKSVIKAETAIMAASLHLRNILKEIVVGLNDDEQVSSYQQWLIWRGWAKINHWIEQIEPCRKSLKQEIVNEITALQQKIKAYVPTVESESFHEKIKEYSNVLKKLANRTVGSKARYLNAKQAHGLLVTIIGEIINHHYYEWWKTHKDNIIKDITLISRWREIIYILKRRLLNSGSIVFH